jgi:hypothetical protein
MTAQNTKAHLEQKERKVMNKKHKQERERIKALKDNDMDAYINLINTQKNSRLMQILEQTHKYLQQLGTKVVLQKYENATLTKKAKSAETIQKWKIILKVRNLKFNMLMPIGISELKSLATGPKMTKTKLMQR